MASQGARKPVQLAAFALVAALLAFQVVRNAAVADRERRPELAAALWPSHPAQRTDRALLAIGTAAARNQPVPAATRAEVRRIAAGAPLSPDPFLFEGAVALSEGRGEAGERLLLAALERDPRSRGTRFLLADRYLRTGRITAGLVEMQVLVSLQSRGAEAFAPALVAYARTPGAISQLRSFFRKYPRVEANVLSVLASDAANANLVLALATGDGVADPNWRATLVSALAAAGQYEKAHAIWARLSRVSPGRGLFNPGFAHSTAPPPFNWHFAQTTEGVAEADGKGGLDVLYYGRAKAVLASQLLLLRPGGYELLMTAEGAPAPGAVHWVVRCARDNKPLADLPLRTGPIRGRFTVPDGCAAQWLELEGRVGETAANSELTIRNLRLIVGGSA